MFVNPKSITQTWIMIQITIIELSHPRKTFSPAVHISTMLEETQISSREKEIISTHFLDGKLQDDIFKKTKRSRKTEKNILQNLKQQNENRLLNKARKGSEKFLKDKHDKKANLNASNRTLYKILEMFLSMSFTKA